MSAATEVTGDLDSNAPLIVDPSTSPTDAFVKEIDLTVPQTVMFVQDMPVTKRIEEVTLGDLALGASCTTPSRTRLYVREHSTGDLNSSTQVAYSASYVAMPSTLGQVTYAIPATTLREGRGYSFLLQADYSGTDCKVVKQRTWAHSGQVNAGPTSCAGAPVSKRMWHVSGLDDSTFACVTRPPGSRTFDYTMPSGWLVSASAAGNWDIMSGTYSGSSPDSNACTTGSSANPRTLGAQPVYWRLLPGSQITKEYVCIWSQFAAPGSDPADGWYYALPWLTEKTGAPRDMYLRLETIDYSSLWEQYSPILIYDSNDEFGAIGPGAATDFYDASDDPDDPLDANRLLDESGAFASANHAVAGQSGIDELSLSYLDSSYGGTSRRSGGPASADDYISERGGGDPQAYAGDAEEMEALPGYANRLYGRVAHDDEGKIWLQYWIFYYADPQENVFGSGMHEGDWELVQVRLDAATQPDRAAYSQHGGGEDCEWSEVETGNGRPIVYVAQDSHAGYFSAGSYVDPNPDDNADGLGDPAQPIPVQVGAETTAWLRWPGQWGDSSSSPAGPMYQSSKWNSPRVWAEQLTACGEVN